MNTIILDPVLKKLLDDLPNEDPYEDYEPNKAIVRIAFFKGDHEVVVGEPTLINFGEWVGPDMSTDEIIVHVKILSTGEERQRTLVECGILSFVFTYGMVFSSAVTVKSR